MTPNKLRVLSISLVAVVAAGIVWAGDSQKSEQQAPAVPQAMPVQVVTVQPGNAVVYQNLPGRVHARKTAEVRARVNGLIEARVFTEGAAVEKGDVLFRIDDRLLQASLSTAKANLDVAKAGDDLGRSTLARYRKLLSKGAVSQQEFDAQNALAKQGKAQVAQAQASVENAMINLEFAEVVAPISGRIGRAMVTEGALVSAQQSTLLAKIEAIDSVYVDFTRSSAEVQHLRQQLQTEGMSAAANDEVEILLGDTPLPEKGKLAFSAMEVDAQTGSMTLRALVANKNQTLLPGMYVRVNVPVLSASSVISVPQKAVEIGAHGAVVYTVEQQQLKPIPIVLGAMSGQNWVVTSGLEAGTAVVVSDITMAKAMRMPVQAMPEPTMHEQGLATPPQNMTDETGQ